MKFVSSGMHLWQIPELAAYEYNYFGTAWMPVGNDRMAFVVVGTNNKNTGSSFVFEADLIPYTGKITFDYGAECTYFFKNGYLHRDNGPAWIRNEFRPSRNLESSQGEGKNGFFICDYPSGEEWALNVFKNFGGEEQ